MTNDGASADFIGWYIATFRKYTSKRMYYNTLHTYNTHAKHTNEKHIK